MEDTQELLTLKDIQAAIGCSYDKLYGYASQKEIQDYVGAVKVPNAKGVRYPQSALQTFGYLLAEQDKGLVSPKNAVEFLSRTQIEEPPTQNGALVPSRPQNRPQDALAPLVREVSTDALGLLERFVVASESRVQTDDELYKSQEAAQFLDVSEDTLRKYFPPSFRIGRSPRWRKSDLLRGPQ